MMKSYLIAYRIVGNYQVMSAIMRHTVFPMLAEIREFLTKTDVVVLSITPVPEDWESWRHENG